jgi:DNA-binding NarL/FixJ family response regulator
MLAGAVGYVLRQLRGHRIVESIRHAAAGESLLNPAVVERIRAGLTEAPTDPGPEALSGGEREVLALMAEGRSNRQISEILGGADRA